MPAFSKGWLRLGRFEPRRERIAGIIERLPQVSRQGGGFLVGQIQGHSGEMVRLTIAGKSTRPCGGYRHSADLRCFACVGDGWQKSFATRPSLRARKNFSQSSACRLSECGSGPRALSGPRASWASRAARTSKPSRVPGGGELAIEGVLQHQVLDDIVFVDAELFGLFRYLLVDQWRTHKSRTDHTGADITARSFFDDHAA